ncbi:flagellar brake protein [Virgibacillus halodenitrificans]|uniref:flagellar brake protein n=1 Tax=Virgibacillus halodenitrificans TaxID=1482 RepID=UPI001F1AF748|nr:flagellar brake domain-containing protein [Virgibacillus halodenitrificans]
MIIGTLLNIEHTRPGERQPTEYYSKVIEDNEEFIYIDYPVNKKTNKTAFLPIGAIFSITYMTKDETIYHFKSELIDRVNMNVPALAIRKPDKSHEKIQRRQFVRIETAIDVAIHPLDNSFIPFTTVTRDISGGGISIILPDHITWGEDKEVDVWLAFGEHTGKMRYLNMKAKTVFVKKEKSTVKIGSFQFTTITKHDQQHIIRYCFEKQRERRKKEISV